MSKLNSAFAIFAAATLMSSVTLADTAATTTEVTNTAKAVESTAEAAVTNTVTPAAAQ